MTGPRVRHGLLLFCLLILSLQLSGVTAARAGEKFPSPWSSAQIDSLLDAHQGEPAVTLSTETRVSVYYDRGRGCLAGDYVVYRDVAALDNKQLAQVCRVFVSDGPMLEFKDFKAHIVAGNGRKTRTHDYGDLDWSSYTPKGNGVVHLDHEVSLAVVPGLRVGDRLQTTTRYKFTSYQGLLPAEMGGGRLATALAVYQVDVPSDYRLVYGAAGDSLLTARMVVSERLHGDHTQHIWSVAAIPARPAVAKGHPDDPGQVTIIPQITGIRGESLDNTFAIGPDWATIAAGYRSRIEALLQPDETVAALTREVTAGAESDQEKIAAIYSYLQTNTRYLGLFEGLGGIIPEQAEDVLKSGYGDCKGLGTLLIAMLRSSGFDAWPALVRTSHLGGLVTDIPNPCQFNHFIVWVDSGPDGIWLDATLDGCPPGYIYPQDAHSPVLALRPGHEGLVDIPFEAWQPGVLTYELFGAIGNDNHLAIRVAVKADGVTGVILRGAGLHRSDDEFAGLRRRMLLPQSIPMEIAANTNCAETDTIGGFALTLASRGGRPLPGAGSSLFLPRVLPHLPRLAKQVDPDFIPDRQEEWRIDLPPGWSVVPDSLNVTDEIVTWNRRVWQEGRSLRLARRVSWRRDAAREMTEDQRDEALAGLLKQVLADERGYITIATAP